MWRDINIKTLWLDVDDYPKIVASADIGVCLHYSSSGLDLPMKVVDMFAAGTPCLAINYQCIDELIQDGQNGRIFSDENELSEQIFETFKGFNGSDEEGGTATLKKYRAALKDFSKQDWD